MHQDDAFRQAGDDLTKPVDIGRCAGRHVTCPWVVMPLPMASGGGRKVAMPRMGFPAWLTFP
jgi:hypothetical protein